VAGFEHTMMKDGVTTLMRADEEASWKQADLFNEALKPSGFQTDKGTSHPARSPYLTRTASFPPGGECFRLCAVVWSKV
jgi:hypothetical protein